LPVGPPSGEALERIVVERLGVALGAPTLRQIEAASGGNPYFALELARSLAARKVPLGPGEPLPVPGSLRTLLGERLANLDRPARGRRPVAGSSGALRSRPGRAWRCGGAVRGGLAPDAAVGDRRRGTAGSRCRRMPLRGRRLRSGPRAAGGGHGDAEQRAG